MRIWGIRYKWNPTICGVLRLASFIMVSVHPHGRLYYVLPSLLLNDIPLSAETTFCFSILQLIKIWMVFAFLAVLNEAAVNVHAVFLRFPGSVSIRGFPIFFTDGKGVRSTEC